MNDHDYSAIPIMSIYNDEFHQDGRSQEFQLTGSAMDDRLDYTAGLYLFKETGTEVNAVYGVNGLWITKGATQNTSYHPGTMYTGMSQAGARPGQAGLAHQRKTRTIDNTSNAFYTQLTYHISDVLHLTGGLRATESEKWFEVFTFRDYCPQSGSKQHPVGGPTANGDLSLIHI